jgi:hypothetical protein
VHGTLLQQSAVTLHACPYKAQGAPPSAWASEAGASDAGPSEGAPSGAAPSVAAPSGTPPSGSTICSPQTPCVDPGSSRHGIPAQQSPSVVQAPPNGTQESPQTNGGPLGLLLGTQGNPQQSALVAHSCPVRSPASAQSPTPVQRGMPNKSCWHAVGTRFTLPAQQLFSALHDEVASLQTAPAGRQAVPLLHLPTGSPGALLQCTDPFPPGIPGDPQQSESSRQTSPVGRHPLGGWQTKIPLGPQGAHDRLQHSPPQTGSPPSVPVAPPPQTSPANVHPVAPGAVDLTHVPSDAPCSKWQIPVQHSALAAQASWVCVQKDGVGAHRWFVHRWEQQSSWVEQALPRVEQAVLSGTQTMAASAPASASRPHRPPQQSASVTHGSWSEMQTDDPQTPFAQTVVQHSVAAPHPSPAALQGTTGFEHTWVAGSQLAEQQSLCVAQVAPASSQSGFTSILASAASPFCALSAASSPWDTSAAPSPPWDTSSPPSGQGFPPPTPSWVDVSDPPQEPRTEGSVPTRTSAARRLKKMTDLRMQTSQEDRVPRPLTGRQLFWQPAAKAPPHVSRNDNRAYTRSVERAAGPSPGIARPTSARTTRSSTRCMARCAGR